MLTLIASLLIGGGLGAALGRFGQCSTGSCPLTANWKRGAVYGAVIGLLFYFTAGGSLRPYHEPKNMKAITATDFEAEVTHADKPVVMDFYAPWCGPCRILSPRLDALAGEYSGKVKFVQMNIEEAPEIASKFNVEGIPTVIFLKNGKVVDTSIGVVSSGILREKLEALTKGSEPAPAPKESAG